MLRMSEACARLGIHRDTMRKYLNEGLIQGRKLPSGHWRIDPDSLNRFLENPEDKKAVDLMRRHGICR